MLPFSILALECLLYGCSEQGFVPRLHSASKTNKVRVRMKVRVRVRYRIRFRVRVRVRVRFRVRFTATFFKLVGQKMTPKLLQRFARCKALQCLECHFLAHQFKKGLPKNARIRVRNRHRVRTRVRVRVRVMIRLRFRCRIRVRVRVWLRVWVSNRIWVTVRVDL
jgi:hypothetical protein